MEKIKSVFVDDMILTKDTPTTAGSKMLEKYVSLFEAEVITRLKENGHSVCGKADVGEFAFDLLGESSFKGGAYKDGKLLCPSCDVVLSNEGSCCICLDVNGYVRRGAAQYGLVSLKPTYGTVSRFGTIPVACSGETVSILAKSSDQCKEVFDVISGHDHKDGTSLPQCQCDQSRYNEASFKRVAVIKPFLDKVDNDVKKKFNDFTSALIKNGTEVCEIENDIIPLAHEAWNVLMCAELCNNVSRYDGVKYGYRAKSFKTIDELYTNSRTEAFGDLLKIAILYGSEALSTENYMKVYDKSLRMRRVVVNEFNNLFKDFDAVLIPACSSVSYKEEAIKENKFIAFEENLFTSPSSITGLPCVCAGGVQVIGKAFSENTLLAIAKLYEQEGK